MRMQAAAHLWANIDATEENVVGVNGGGGNKVGQVSNVGTLTNQQHVRGQLHIHEAEGDPRAHACPQHPQVYIDYPGALHLGNKSAECALNEPLTSPESQPIQRLAPAQRWLLATI